MKIIAEVAEIFAMILIQLKITCLCPDCVVSWYRLRLPPRRLELWVVRSNPASESRYEFILTEMGWATFWATFSQTHLVAVQKQQQFKLGKNMERSRDTTCGRTKAAGGKVEPQIETKGSPVDRNYLIIQLKLV
jgi:hypothetical protein